MKHLRAALAIGLAFTAGAALSAEVRDWRDLENVHRNIVDAIHTMEQARAANHYDMDGHGAKAEAKLREAEHELSLAIESAHRH